MTLKQPRKGVCLLSCQILANIAQTTLDLLWRIDGSLVAENRQPFHNLIKVIEFCFMLFLPHFPVPDSLSRFLFLCDSSCPWKVGETKQLLK
jgi:hypothetical protein